MSDVTEGDRELARQAMIKGYHDCGARWQAAPGRTCDCDDSRIDGCKARVEAIAAALVMRRSVAQGKADPFSITDRAHK